MKLNIFVLLFLISSFTFGQSKSSRELDIIERETIGNLIELGLINKNDKVKLDSFYKDVNSKELLYFFSKQMGYRPIRENYIIELNNAIKENQSFWVRRKYSVKSFINETKIEEYVPNVYRKNIDLDTLRNKTESKNKVRHVTNYSSKNNPNSGLNNKHIAIWGGHGRVYSNNDNNWTWQRPNLFTTVEDLYTMSYVVPYIIPMLENAGANVYYPKERDIQTEEIVIDNINKNVIKSSAVNTKNGGFKYQDFYTDYENPFNMGNHLEMESSYSSTPSAYITYNINANKSGNYGVYISYAKTNENLKDVTYKLVHSGGETTFKVNQTMGFNTWVYLGNFHFNKDEKAYLKVLNTNAEKGIISSDAIKIGGGYNRIKRNNTTTLLPAFTNSSRYFLQYSGAPSKTVYSLSDYKSDYKDDYRGKGEWVNWMLGKEYFKNRDSVSTDGLNIPIDLSLSLHTDAGNTKKDSIIGSLAIYSSTNYKKGTTFTDGRSRISNRDFADILQTELTETIQKKYCKNWNRREIWDKRYSEATYPNVPSMIIELLAHQNFEDMKYGLDPNFKFDVSRAIYKGILKYLASTNNTDYTVTPLPVHAFAISYRAEKLSLLWSETTDLLEETASADKFIIYTKIGNNGFDNGVLVNKNEYTIPNFEYNKTYSFKVTAVNDGGESFDSEILSANIVNNDKEPVLIVNGFEKTSAPDFLETDSIAGFVNWKKSGIANGYEYSYSGNQYNFNRNDDWISNALTGHGASYSTYEGQIKAGNTFDYPLKHGKHFTRNKISYISTSLKGFERYNYSNIKKIDIIYGKQSSISNSKKDYSVFRTDTRKALNNWFKEGNSILISGAFIASDVFKTNANDEDKTNWVKDKLGYTLVTDNASENGNISGILNITLSKNPSKDIYELRSVDALKNIIPNEQLFIYDKHHYPAGIFNTENGINKIILGFPILSNKDKENELFDFIIKKLLW